MARRPTPVWMKISVSERGRSPRRLPCIPGGASMEVASTHVPGNSRRESVACTWVLACFL